MIISSAPIGGLPVSGNPNSSFNVSLYEITVAYDSVSSVKAGAPSVSEAVTATDSVSAELAGLFIDGSANNDGVPANPTTATLTTTQSNDVIFAYLGSWDSGQDSLASSVTDTAGLSWQRLVYVQNGGYLEVWYAISPSPLTNDVISANYPSGDRGDDLVVWGVAGANVNDPITGTPETVGSGNVKAGEAPSVTTTVANAMVFGALNNQTTSNPTSASGWATLISGDNQLINYQIVSDVGTYTPSESPDNTDIWAGIAFAVAPLGSPVVIAVSETAAPTDNVNIPLQFGVSETASATDSVAVTLEVPASVSESTAVSDSVASTLVGMFLDGTATNNTQLTNPATVTLSTTQSNDVIVVVANEYGDAIAVSDEAGLTWTRYTGLVSGESYEEIWYAIAPAPLTNDVITFHYSGSTTGYQLQAFGVAGADTTTPFNGTPGLYTGGTGGAGPSVSTTAPVTFVVGGLADGGGTVSPSPGVGWNNIESQNYNSVFYAIQTSTGTYTPQMSPNNSEVGYGIAFAIQAAGQGMYVSVSDTAAATDEVAVSLSGLFIDGSNAVSTPSNPATLTLTTTQANDVVFIFSNSDQEPTGVSDSAGLTWISIAAFKDLKTNPPDWAVVWYAIAPDPLTNDTISVSYPSTQQDTNNVQVWAVAGANVYNPINGTPGTFLYTGGATDGPETTTYLPITLVLGTLNQNTEQNPTSGAGWYNINVNNYALVNYTITSSAGTYMPQESPNNSDIEMGVAIAIAPSFSPFGITVAETAEVTDSVSAIQIHNIGVFEDLFAAESVSVTSAISVSVSESSTTSDSVASTLAGMFLDGSATNNAQLTNPATVTLSTTQSNDLIVVVANEYGDAASVSDEAGLTWTRYTGLVSGGSYEEIWYAIAPDPLTNDVITFTYSGSVTGYQLQAFGVAGADTSAPFNGTPGLYTGGTGGAGPSVTTTASVTFVVGGLANGASVESPPPGAGWNNIESQNYNSVFYAIEEGAGTYTPQMSPSNTQIGYGIAFAIQAISVPIDIAVSESATASDAVTANIPGIYNVSLAETVSATDSVSATYRLPAAVSETALASDQALVASHGSAAVSEVVSASDGVSYIYGLGISVSELATATDTVTGIKSAYTGAVIEAISAFDQVAETMSTVNVGIEEIADATDIVTAYFPPVVVIPGSGSALFQGY